SCRQGEHMKRIIIFIAALFSVLAINLSLIAGAQSAPCASSGGLNFICGLQAPEDLVLLPGTRWLIASGMAAGSGLHLIDTQAKTARTLFGSGAAATRADKNKIRGWSR